MANIKNQLSYFVQIVLLFHSAFFLWFYILYLLNRFIDMIDGIVARKSSSVNEFSSKLDMVADFIFAVACLIKLLPAIDIPT